MSVLTRAFYEQDTLTVARALLGKHLVRYESGNRQTGGIIIETEAYIGSTDLGCHAHSGRTRRNASMWGPAGHAYIYFTYGMHWMFNIVTGKIDHPAAVLIRAIFPQEGIERMRKRRQQPDRILCDGPAKLCQALSINGDYDGLDLLSENAAIRLKNGVSISPAIIATSARIGLNNVPEPWKSIPWRFHIPHSACELLVQKNRQA